MKNVEIPSFAARPARHPLTYRAFKHSCALVLPVGKARRDHPPSGNSRHNQDRKGIAPCPFHQEMVGKMKRRRSQRHFCARLQPGCLVLWKPHVLRAMGRCADDVLIFPLKGSRR